MPLRRLPDDEKWTTPKACHHPEHNPPGMIVLDPGTYEHTCPGCNKNTVFTVPERPSCTTGVTFDPSADYCFGYDWNSLR